MATSTTGGGINIPIRIGMSPTQAQQVAQASGRSFGQAFQQGFASAMGAGGGNPLTRLWNTMQGGIASAGYGNYTGPRTPGMMAATYLWRGMLGRGTVSGMVGRIGATALGFGALGSLPQAIGEHIQTSKAQEQSLSDLNRRTGESLKTFGEFRSLVLDTGKDLGYTREQIIQMTNAYVSGVGRMNQVALSKNLTGMMQLGKAYGIDPQAVVALQTQVFRGGGTTAMNPAFAGSVEFGGMRGRENEVVTAIENLTSMLEKNLPSVGDITPMLGLMTAMNASGNQGLMGQRGVELMGAVQNFTTGAGGGPRQNLMLQMIASQRKAAGLPALGYAEMLYQSEEGLKNQGNLDALAFGVNKFLPKGPYQNVFLGQMLGISQHQAEALAPILASGGGGFAGGFGALTKAIGGRDVNAMALPFMARALGAGGLSGAMGVASDFAGTMDQRTAQGFMSKAGMAKTPEEVAAVIAEYSNSTDQLLTAADKTTKAFTDFDNSLTDLAGQLNKILTESLKAWTNIFNLLGGGAGAIIDITGAAHAASFAIYAMTAAAAASAVKNGVTGLGNLMFGTGGPAVLRTPTGRGPANAATRAGMGARATIAGGALLGGAEVISDVISGGDPWESLAHRGLTTLTSILGGAAGAALGSGVASIPLGAAGAIGGNALGEWAWQNLVAPTFFNRSAGTGSTSTTGNTSTFLGGNATAFTAGRNPFDFPVTQGFGVPEYFNGKFLGPHTGLDLGLPAGTSIAALQSGIVKGYRSEPNAGGNIMDLLMNGGETMSLAHLSKYLLKPGDAFQAGQAVALSGSTGGYSTGPHLHMEVKDALGRLMDPQQWYNNLRLRGQLDLNVNGGGADGQYKVPVTIGGGSLAGLLNGSYG